MRRRVSPVLVGRQHELDGLADAVSVGSVVVVDGESGIGKSRLVSEAMRMLPSRRLVGQCEAVREPYPLGPVFDAVRGAGRWLPSAERSGPLLGALVPYLPELAEWLPPAPAPLADPAAERHRLFRATVALLDAIGSTASAEGTIAGERLGSESRREPQGVRGIQRGVHEQVGTVLVLEDMHWAAASTVEFVCFLAAHMPPGLALVLTARTDEGVSVQIAEELARARTPVTRLTLAPLPSPEVRRLAELILETDDLPDVFVKTLADRTDGVPFLIEEVLATLETADQVAEGTGDLAEVVPTPVRDLIVQRWRRLPASARQVIAAAAVFGDRIDESVLAEVVRLDPSAVADALSEATACGLVVEDGGCRFRHALARRAVYEAVPVPQRRQLHVRAALALQDGSGNEPAATLAYHFGHAGRRHEFVHYAEIAADQAMAHGNDSTAAGFLLDAIRVEGLGFEDRARIGCKLARAAVDGLAQQAAIPVLEDLLDDARLTPDVRGELRFMLGRLLRQQGEAMRGYEQIEASVADLADDPAQRARALAILSVPDIVTGRHLSEHMVRAEQAAEAAHDSGDGRVDLPVRIARASLLLAAGDPAGWELADVLRRDPRLQDAPRELARACLNWSQEALYLGYLGRARSLLAEGRHALVRAEYARLSGVADLVAGWIDYACGDGARLEPRARALVAEFDGFAAAGLDARLLLGAVLARRGDPEAAPLLHDVVQTAAEVGAVRPLVAAHAVFARTMLDAGDPEAAAREARRGLAEIRAKGTWVWAGDVALSLVDALDALGRAAEAGAIVAELAEGTRSSEAPLVRATLQHCQAAVAHADRDSGADAVLDRARQEFAALAFDYEYARATARLGRWRCDRGAPDGPGLLEDALRAFARHGADREAASTIRDMRVRGVPVPYPWRGGRRSYGEALSPREREVATLAAEGLTNQEIATRLALSRRTVESHVAHALRKLGGSSRRDLGRLLDAADRMSPDSKVQ